MELLKDNITVGLVLLAFFSFIVTSLRRDKETVVRNMLLYLVTEAEAMFGNGTGEIKYAAVVTWTHERLPILFKILFTEKQLDRMIEDAVRNLTQYLKTNPDLDKIMKEEGKSYERDYDR